LFKFLNRYLTSKAKMVNSTNAGDLALVVSPYVCKPEKSAFMSIRHMDDLRRIRPIIAFIVERCLDIFTKDLKPLPKLIPADNGSSKLLRMQSKDSSSAFYMASDAKDSPVVSTSSSRKVMLPTLLVSADSTSLSRDSSTSSVSSFTMSSALSEDTSLSQNPELPRSLSSLNITRWEMKILENIVQHISTSYLKRNADYFRRNQATNPTLSMSSSDMSSSNDHLSDMDDNLMKNYSKDLSVSAGVYSYRTSISMSPTGLDSPTGAFSNLAINTSDPAFTFRHGNAFENSPRFQDAKKWTRRRERGLRRRLISECKAIRNQVGESHDNN
jgi:hypothetical protein